MRRRNCERIRLGKARRDLELLRGVRFHIYENRIHAPVAGTYGYGWQVSVSVQEASNAEDGIKKKGSYLEKPSLWSLKSIS